MTRLVLFTWLALASALHAAPLRVLVASDAEVFRADYSAALKQAGVTVTGITMPAAAQLAGADVVVLHRSKFESLPAETQTALTAFAQRGGGIVAVNAAVVAGDVAWGKALLGGAWDGANSQKFASRMMLCVRPDVHPILREASQFDVDDARSTTSRSMRTSLCSAPRSHRR